VKPVLNFFRTYPWVLAALIVGIVGLLLPFAGAEIFTPWIVGGFAGVVAITQAWGMIKSILKGHWGLDVLAVTAIISTLAVGEFWASLIIVLMLTGGEALEDFAAVRAKRDLQALFDRVPTRAHRVLADGSIEDIDADAIAVGDRILVRPSEIVPVDGPLRSESADFDESSLTGESLPVSKSTGDMVLSGSVNGSRAVEIVAEKEAKDSQFQRIVALVNEASDSKAPLVRLADRYAVPFTAVAYVIAGLAWYLSGDAVRFAEVLVVATPCPLLIAAPVAFMGGMSRAAKSGVVIKDAGTLERLAEVRTLALDKTGTLTYGHPEVSDIRAVSGDGNELLSMVASAEQYSSHVLAHAIVSEAKNRGATLVDADSAEEVATHGVRATLKGVEVIVGKPGFVAEHASGVVEEDLQAGEIVIYAAIGGKFAGAIVLKDTIRTEAKSTLDALRARGVEQIVMVSGDSQATTSHVAEELGVTRAHGGLLPEDKVTIVKSLEPRNVMMVGDGVNDAPVLASADVGVAMGAKGSTVAGESADVVILVDNLEVVYKALSVGSRTIRIALQSIWLGIVISVGLMLLAAFGHLPAIYGALLQEVVDLVAILGALRAVQDRD